MYKRIVFPAAALALALSAGAVQAQDVHIGLSGNLSQLQDADNSGALVDIESRFDRGYGLSGHVGTHFGAFRLEGELGWNKSDVDKLAITNDGGFSGGAANGLTLDADGDLTALVAMVNGYYDFDTGSAWTPYVGAGIGLARISADVDVLGVDIVDDDDTVFAYQARAGVGYAVSGTATIFGGYKYFATQDPSFSGAAGSGFDSEYRSHNIEIGVRFEL